MYMSHPRQLIFLRKSDGLGCAVLLYVVCLFDLACFFLSSFSSLTCISHDCISHVCVMTQKLLQEKIFAQGFKGHHLAYAHFTRVQRSAIASMQSGAEPVDCIYMLIVSDDL